MPAPSNPLPANVLDALQAGDKIEAIKLLREATGLGLKESKDAIDEHEGGSPRQAVTTSSRGQLPEPVVEALLRGSNVEAIRLLRKSTGLGLKEAKDWVDASAQEVRLKAGIGAPGEVSRSGSLAWYVIAALVIAALLAYYFLGRPR